MKRRTFVKTGLAVMIGSPLFAALRQQQLEEAAAILNNAVSSGQVAAASIYASQRELAFMRAFGKAQDVNAMFLLGSISKPVCMTALMTLFDGGEFKLADPLQKFIPQFAGDRRERVTMQH